MVSKTTPDVAQELQAIVIGGSITGLLAACVLSKTFATVTIIDRDLFPNDPSVRVGAPQARHFHVLQPGGRRILEQLFPGIGDDLVASGAHIVETGADTLTLLPSGWAPRAHTGVMTSASSRGLLEWVLRRRTLRLPQVRLIQSQEVTELLVRNGRVAGVKLRARGQGPAAPISEQWADLVVDASGRSSHAPEWLAALGYGTPTETIVDAHLGYATRCYRRREAWPSDWKGILLLGKAPRIPRGGVIFPIEGDQWIVTLAGYADHQPPTDEVGFLAFAQSLRSPIIYDIIKAAEPMTPIYSYRRTENRLRHFERLARWPAGLIVLGDAVCSFNPIYGQGMTAAARSALLLGTCLAGQRTGIIPDGFEQRFQKQLARLNADTWIQATSEDFRYPTTSGARPGWWTRPIYWYFDRVLDASVDSAVVFSAFAQVLAMLKPSSSLLHPRLVARVLAHTLRTRRLRPQPQKGEVSAVAMQ